MTTYITTKELKPFLRKRLRYIDEVVEDIYNMLSEIDSVDDRLNLKSLENIATKIDFLDADFIKCTDAFKTWVQQKNK